MTEAKELAVRLQQLCQKRGLSLGAVESLTGGELAATLVTVPGASKVFRGALVTYTDEVKTALVGVSPELLHKKTPYCAEVALQMAQGGAKALGVDVCISTTGVAGPGSDRGIRPGTLYIGLFLPAGKSQVRQYSLAGSRCEIRRKCVVQSLKLGLKNLQV